jgi:hypothetical protein
VGLCLARVTNKTVLYAAEAAMEAHDGRTRLHGAGSRPLVVAFANPKKIRPGEPPEPAIAPRKLFVGQVLRAFGAPC